MSRTEHRVQRERFSTPEHTTHTLDDSFEYPNDGNASPPQGEYWDGEDEDLEHDEDQVADEEEEGGEDDEEGEEEEEEEYDGSSDTSSALFDPKADPDGFAKRLDELAGVLEVGEEEARALKWGAPMKKQANGQLAWGYISPNEFRTLIDKHITETEWKYNTIDTTQIHDLRTDRQGGVGAWGGIPPGMHSIRVTGRGGDAFDIGPEVSDGVLGIEGLPSRTR